MVVPPIISDSTKPTSVRVAAPRLTRALSGSENTLVGGLAVDANEQQST